MQLLIDVCCNVGLVARVAAIAKQTRKAAVLTDDDGAAPYRQGAAYAPTSSDQRVLSKGGSDGYPGRRKIAFDGRHAVVTACCQSLGNRPDRRFRLRGCRSARSGLGRDHRHLPVSAGPAYVFLAMQHGPDFVATSTLNSAAANAATGLFLITYGILARRLSPWPSLGVALAVWLAASLAVQQTACTVTRAIVLNLAVYGPGLVFVNSDVTAESEPARPLQRQWFDLPLRAASVAAFVSLVVAVSAALGPAATGIAAVFPVSLISMIVILQPRIGGPASACMATNALLPMLGFGIMLFVMHVTVQSSGVTAAFGFAFAVCVTWSGVLLLLLTSPNGAARKERAPLPDRRGVEP